jgi:hypothetical protein
MPIILVGESLAEIERHLEALKKIDALKAPAPAGRPAQAPAAGPPGPANTPAAAAAPPAPVAAPPQPADSQEALNRKVGRLKHRATRTTGKVWDLVVAAANLPPGQEFSLDDLARSMGERASRVRSWHRILARPTKRLKLTVFVKVEGAERPTKFTMPPEVRQAVALANKVGAQQKPKKARVRRERRKVKNQPQ